MVVAVGALLPLADWPVHGGTGGRSLNSESGSFVSFRTRHIVRKMTQCLTFDPSGEQVWEGTGLPDSAAIAAAYSSCPSSRVGCFFFVYGAPRLISTVSGVSSCSRTVSRMLPWQNQILDSVNRQPTATCKHFYSGFCGCNTLYC